MPYTPLQTSQTTKSNIFSLGLGLRPLFSQMLSLRTRFKVRALFRGLGISTFIFVFESVIVVSSISLLPSLLAIAAQTLLPLLLVQFYTLWTHTVLTYPSSAKSFRQRIPPFRATLRTTGPALAVFLATNALQRFVLMSMSKIDGLSKRGDLDPQYLGALILAGALVEAIAVVPAHIVLTRIQTSLLPADEQIVLSIDDALTMDGKGGESNSLGMKDAWRTFGRAVWIRFGMLYGQVFVVVLICGGAVLAAAFVFNIVFGLASR